MGLTVGPWHSFCARGRESIRGLLADYSPTGYASTGDNWPGKRYRHYCPLTKRYIHSYIPEKLSVLSQGPPYRPTGSWLLHCPSHNLPRATLPLPPFNPPSPLPSAFFLDTHSHILTQASSIPWTIFGSNFHERHFKDQIPSNAPTALYLICLQSISFHRPFASRYSPLRPQHQFIYFRQHLLGLDNETATVRCQEHLN